MRGNETRVTVQVNGERDQRQGEGQLSPVIEIPRK
jgi:hypothetical protein